MKGCLSHAPIVAFDFETTPDKKYRNEEKTALDAYKNQIVGISFSVAEGSYVYMPLAHRIVRNVFDPQGIATRAKVPAVYERFLEYIASGGAADALGDEA